MKSETITTSTCHDHNVHETRKFDNLAEMCRNTEVCHLIPFLVFCILPHSFALEPNTAELISLPPRSTVSLQVNNITNGSSYVIFQAQSQYKNVTLSLHQDITMETSETGRSVGVLIIVRKETTLKVFLTSHHNSTLKVLVHVRVEKNAFAPVPGGCNLEFNMENDPNIHLDYTSDLTNVKYQWAKSSVSETSCEMSPTLTQMSYHLYVYYIGDNDWDEQALFDGMRKMISAEDVMRHGRKLKEIKYSSSKLPWMKLPSYTGQGTIYNIVVKYGDKMAAYVPMSTYSCNLGNRDSECKNSSLAVEVLITISGVVGLFLCFLGHRYFQSGNFLMSFCGFCVVFYLVLSITTNQSLLVVFVLACILATVSAVLWLMVWWVIGQPVLSLLVPGCTAGYLFACILFYTPFGNIHYWTVRYNYGMTFCVCVLVMPVLLLYWTRMLNILSCAFIGSFLTVLSLDVWINSGLKYIVINSFRHAYNTDYLDVTVTAPFGNKDIILSCVWGVLFISGTSIQVYRERNRPEFPPCPRKRRLRHIESSGLDQSIRPQSEEEVNNYNEQSPLIRHGVSSNYTQECSNPT